MKKYFRYRYSKPKNLRRGEFLNQGETDIEVYGLSSVRDLMAVFYPAIHDIKIINITRDGDSENSIWRLQCPVFGIRNKKRIYLGWCNFYEDGK